VKNANEYAKKLRALLDRQAAEPFAEEMPLEPLGQLIYAALLWETTRKQAEQGYRRLMSRVVDVNELRVSDPSEIIAALGPRYSKVGERAMMLRQTLQAIYEREHAVDLKPLIAMPKREARQYLETLEGIEPFVAASVLLISLEAHAVPVDEQLVRKLKKDGIVDEEADLDDARSFLEHHIKASEGLEAHCRLRTYVEGGSGGETRRTTRKKTTTKKSSKKASKKATKRATRK